MEENWYLGRAGNDTGEDGGWLLGAQPGLPEGIRQSASVEVRWGIHPAGQQRPGWSIDERRTTLLLLVSGRFRLDLTVGSALLEHQGDYVVWGPGIDHSWVAQEDSVVVGVRWPAILR